MIAWLIAVAVVYGATFVYFAVRYAANVLQKIYAEGVRSGRRMELDRVLDMITQATWVFRREQYGLYAYCKLSSDIGEIPLPGPTDFEDGEIVLIQRKLPHHTRCPFFLLGYEAHLTATVYRSIPVDIDEYDDS